MAVTIVRTTNATQLNSLLSQASASTIYLTQASASVTYAPLPATPVGTIVMYGGTTAPTGWLLCNGQSTSGYADLAAVVGGFVPDLRGRAPIGYGTSTDTTNVPTARTTIGATTGAEAVTLTSAQSGVPAHSHANTAAFTGTAVTSGDDSPDHAHAADMVSIRSTNATGAYRSLNFYSIFNDISNTGTSNPDYYGAATLTTGGTSRHQHSVTAAGTVGVTNVNNTVANASSSHQNMQPSTVVNFIIKT
jgi:microcystin-dependent protein